MATTTCGGNVDPFTSGGAYRPGPLPNANRPAGGGFEDPLSAKRYRPGNAPAPGPAPAAAPAAQPDLASVAAAPAPAP